MISAILVSWLIIYINFNSKTVHKKISNNKDFYVSFKRNFLTDNHFNIKLHILFNLLFIIVFSSKIIQKKTIIFNFKLLTSYE
jgi:hypothetical protein